MSAIYDLYDGLNRLGPGDEASLSRAFAFAGIGPSARVLDAGAGRGADIPALLAQVPQGSVVAVEQHAPWADETAARHAGDERVHSVAGDMADPPQGPYDLIWSAGAVYFLGIEPALRGWRQHLAPGGRVVFSEIGYRENASAVVRDYWEASYPDMTDQTGIEAQVTRAGFGVLGAFWLSKQAWANFYTPLAARLADIRARSLQGAGGPDPDMESACAEAEAEIALWQQHGAEFGYLCVVAEPA
jgi:protein-L-isoaspartate O-methyltransferase